MSRALLDKLSQILLLHILKNFYTQLLVITLSALKIIYLNQLFSKNIEQITRRIAIKEKVSSNYFIVFIGYGLHKPHKYDES